MKNNKYKTLGHISSKIITELKREGRNIFRLNDVCRILEREKNAAADLLSEMAKRKIILRLKPGLYVIIPMESEKYFGNWYVVASELISPCQYYISHYSALAIHGMTTQPVLDVYLTSNVRRRNKKIVDVNFYFLCCCQKKIFGIEEHWLNKQEKVKVSDVEKTIIDAFSRPQLCGGISEIAKGIWLKRNEIDYNRLVEYCFKLDVKAVAKRMGFVLEGLDLGGKSIWEELKKFIDKSEAYVLLDPSLKREGKHLGRWRLLVNFDFKEVLSIIWR